MGRGAGCCNFKYTINCTAPPCPSGTCCYVNLDNISNTISIEDISEQYLCEESITENCCLAKPFSMFKKDATCGELQVCGGQSSVAIPMVASTEKAFALLKHDGTVVTWGTFPLATREAFLLTSKAQDSKLRRSGENPHKNIVDIVANKNAFLFLNKDGWYTTWGDPAFGGINGGAFSTPNYVFEVNRGCTTNLKQDCLTSEQIPVPRSRLKQGSIVPINTGLRYSKQPSRNSFTGVEDDISYSYSKGRNIISRGGFAGISLEGKLVIFYSDFYLGNTSQENQLTPPFVLSFGGNNDGQEMELPDEVKDKTDIVEVASFDHYIAARDSSGKVFILELPITTGTGFTGTFKRFRDAKLVDALIQVGPDPTTFADFDKLNTSDLNTDVKKIYSNRFSFAFLKNDGTVFTWGLQRINGIAYDSPHDEKNVYLTEWGANQGGLTGEKQSLLTDVKEIYNTEAAFLAHRKDNKIVVWGDIRTNAGPDSDFYSEVLDVFPSKNAFGISYILQTEDVDPTLPTITFITHDHFFDVLGEIVYFRGAYVEARVVNYLSSSPTSNTYNGDRFDDNRSPTKVHVGRAFYTTYTGPYDHENPPLNSEFQPIAYERDFYASDYVFHFTTRIKHSTAGLGGVVQPRSEPGFYSIGQSSRVGKVDDEHYSHLISEAKSIFGAGLTLKKGGVSPPESTSVSRNEVKLVDTPSRYDTDTETLEEPMIRGAKNYVFSIRATAFLTKGETPAVIRTRIHFGNPKLGKDHVVSLGHADYGGIGSSYLRANNSLGSAFYSMVCRGVEDCLKIARTINQTAFPSPLESRILDSTNGLIDSQRANFVGLYSNGHAFCGVRMHDPVTPREYGPDGIDGEIHPDNQDGEISYGVGSRATYEIFTWGDDDFGGDSSDVDFSNVFANMKNITFSYQGCDPDYCNQDIK